MGTALLLSTLQKIQGLADDDRRQTEARPGDSGRCRFALAGAALVPAKVQVRASTSFSLSGAEATIRGLVGWQHAFGDTAPASALSFDGGTSFLVAGAPIAKNAAVLEAGLDLAMSGNATCGVSYQGQLAGRAQQHGFDASLSLKF